MLSYDPKILGQIIRELRLEKSFSQELLSSFAGIARSHLSMIESGRKQANLDTIWRIANALDISPHELIENLEETMIKPQK